MGKLDDADSLLKTKDYKKALEIYLGATESNPRDARAYQGIAQCRYALSQNDEAITACKKALDIDSSLSIPHIILAFIHGRRNNLENSRKEALTALELAPDSFDALDCFGFVLLMEGKNHEGISVLQRALVVNQNAYSAHLNLAIAYQRLGDSKREFEESKIVFRLRPSVKNWFRLAFAFQRYQIIPATILFVCILVAALLLKAKFLLIIPGLYAAWNIYVIYLYLKARLWRKAITEFVSTIFYIIALYIIYIY